MKAEDIEDIKTGGYCATCLKISNECVCSKVFGAYLKQISVKTAEEFLNSNADNNKSTLELMEEYADLKLKEFKQQSTDIVDALYGAPKSNKLQDFIDKKVKEALNVSEEEIKNLSIARYGDAQHFCAAQRDGFVQGCEWLLLKIKKRYEKETM